MIYRVDELATALQSQEYDAFLRAVEEAPPANRALIYYESAPNASHYFFALAASNGASCTLTISDLHGVRERECQRVPEYQADLPIDPRAIRDPGVAGLVQFGSDGGEPRKAMSLLPDQEPSGVAQDDMLFDKIERIFG